MKSKTIYFNDFLVTRLFQVLMLIAFLSFAAHYPEAQQILKYISYISLILFLFSIKFFLFENIKIIHKHFNQLFFVFVAFLHRNIVDLSFEGFDTTFNLEISKVWLRFTDDYFLNTIILGILLAAIFLYLLIIRKEVSNLKSLLLKLGFLIIFFCLTIYLQIKIQYFIEYYV
jgi:hypothetical protein